MRHIVFIGLFLPAYAFPQKSLVLKKVIKGGLTPKSVVASGNGLVFAQNMMYSHTVTVYNRDYQLVKTLKDNITPSDYGFSEFTKELKGSPVECAFSDAGKYAWVSNYNMSGEGYTNPGCDSCHGKNYDGSFIYKINTATLKVENIVEAGSVPKYLCVSPDNKYLLVSNWSSGDVSVIDLKEEKEIKKIAIGPHPRGIVIDSKSENAYVGVMGSNWLAKINLKTFEKENFLAPGKGPRHLCISPDDKWLYVSLNAEHTIAKIDLATKKTEKIKVKGMPRSMVLDEKANALYAVNYSGAQLLKIDCENFCFTDTIKTYSNPIGITYDNATNEVWVACYSGSIMVFEDTSQKKNESEGTLAFLGELTGNTLESLDKLNMIDNITSSVRDKKKTENINALVVSEVKKETLKPELKKTEAVSKVEKVEIPAVAANSVSSSGYYVVVGSFKNPDNAKRKAGSMKDKGYDCTTFPGTNGMTYTAFGSYPEKTEADKMLTKIKSEETGAWILKKD